jgi:glycosyltransferase involved in cell wall biosynthesis
MKLDIISPYPPAITGIGQYGYHVSRALEESGLFSKITILAGAQPDLTTSAARVPSSATIQVDYAWRPDHPETFGAILAGIQHRKPDLVWFNIGASVFGRSPLANLLGLANLGLVRALGYPTVVTLHELVELADLKTLKAPGGKLAQCGARLLTHLATNADVVCLTMKRYIDWFRWHKPFLRTVHTPIGAYQTPAFVPEPEQPELLFFTTLAPYKGLEILLVAYRELLSNNPALRLTIAGTEHPRFPGYSQHLREISAALPGVRFLGQVAEAEIRGLFAQSSIVVLPYLASTGSSSVLYQAAAWGRALVASDLPETQNVAAESGLKVNFYPTHDADALAASIQRMLAAPAARAAQTRHNFSAIQNIRPEDTCKRYVRAFNLALEMRHISKRLSTSESISQEAA